MQLGNEFLILSMTVFILIRSFLKERAANIKNRLILLSITEVIILFLFNTIMYIETEGFGLFMMDYPPTYLLIALIIFINVFLIYQLVKRFKNTESQAT